MKITLDQDALAKAVISHLRSVGVTSDITQVVFRYTRVPYTVFAEVELSEAKAQSQKRAAVIAEPEVAEAIPASAQPPMVDPDSLPVEEPEPAEPLPAGPSSPMFGG